MTTQTAETAAPKKPLRMLFEEVATHLKFARLALEVAYLELEVGDGDEDKRHAMWRFCDRAGDVLSHEELAARGAAAQAIELEPQTYAEARAAIMAEAAELGFVCQRCGHLRAAHERDPRPLGACGAFTLKGNDPLPPEGRSLACVGCGRSTSARVDGQPVCLRADCPEMDKANAAAREGRSRPFTREEVAAMSAKIAAEQTVVPGLTVTRDEPQDGRPERKHIYECCDELFADQAAALEHLKARHPDTLRVVKAEGVRHA